MNILPTSAKHTKKVAGVVPTTFAQEKRPIKHYNIMLRPLRVSFYAFFLGGVQSSGTFLSASLVVARRST